MASREVRPSLLHPTILGANGTKSHRSTSRAHSLPPPSATIGLQPLLIERQPLPLLPQTNQGLIELLKAKRLPHEEIRYGGTGPTRNHK